MAAASSRRPSAPTTPFPRPPHRGRAAEIITAAKTGRDLTGRILPPQASDAPTVYDLAERFLEEHAAGYCKPSTAHSYALAIRRHVLPRLGGRRVGEVTRADVASLHHAMRTTPFAANRTLGILSAMFSAAEVWGLRQQGTNPCRYVKRFPRREARAVPVRRGVPASRCGAARGGAHRHCGRSGYRRHPAC